MSSRILVEDMGGPDSLVAALGSDFKVSNNRMQAKALSTNQNGGGLTVVRQAELGVALLLISIKKVNGLWDVQVEQLDKVQYPVRAIS